MNDLRDIIFLAERYTIGEANDLLQQGYELLDIEAVDVITDREVLREGQSSRMRRLVYVFGKRARAARGPEI
jgi:hypothetical protein